MKIVAAIIKPFKLDDVREALSEMEIEGLTVTEVKGMGRHKAHTDLYRSSESTLDFMPKIKLEIAANEDQIDHLVDVIVNTAKTGKVGDGRVFVYDLTSAVRIRTGELNSEAV